MSTDTHAMDIQTCLDRLCQAMNSHDMEAFLQCFHATYASDQPAHPSHALADMRKSGKIGRPSSPGYRTSKPSYCARA